MCLAAPARVISISENTATVDYGGVETKCRLETLTEEVAVDDYVLIHTGFAIRRLSPEDGEETLRLFDELAASLERSDAAGREFVEKPAENPDEPDSPVCEPSNLASAPTTQTSSESEPNAASSAASEAPPEPEPNPIEPDSAVGEPSQPEEQKES